MDKIAKVILIFLIVIALTPAYALKGVNLYNATYLQTIEYESFLETTGVIDTENYTAVSLSYPICVKECYVNNGNYVNKGQLLCTVDKEQLELLVKSNSFTQISFMDNSLANYNISYIPDAIYAPESGYIGNLSAKKGSFIMNDENLCTITGSEDMILKISINQEDFEKISIGDTVQFSPLVAPSKSFTAQVCNKTANIIKEVSLNGSKTVVEIYAVPLCESEYLINGVQFKGKIITDPKRNISILPHSYINQDNNGEYVFIYKNGIVDKQYIETGTETGDYAEIVTPFDNDTVFIENSYTGGKLIIRYAE